MRTKHDRKITNVTKNCSHANKLFAIPSASQYLYAQCRVECNNFSYYMAKPVLSKFVRCNWFFLCLTMETVQAVYFFLEQSRHYVKFTTKQRIKVNIVIFSFSVKLLKEAEKIENLLFKISKINEEDEHSPNETTGRTNLNFILTGAHCKHPKKNNLTDREMWLPGHLWRPFLN